MKTALLYLFCFVLLCIWGHFPSTSPRGLILEFEGIKFGGAYTRRGSVFGILRSITRKKSYQSLRSLESWNRCRCPGAHRAHGFHFLLVVCSQVWCSPYLVENVGFFELRTFPWLPNKVEVGTFYLFTIKVGSKYTFIILEALGWSRWTIEWNELKRIKSA